MTDGRVVQVGPALSLHGGISAVERLIVENVGASIPMRHIDTMEDGTTWTRLRVFARALIELRSELRSERPLVVHVHYASRGSTVRKIILAWMTLRARRPLVLHAHGGGFDTFYTSLPRIAQRVVRNVFARADCFVVVSSQWREFYAQRCGVPSNRIVVLGNPTVVPAETVDRAGRSSVQFVSLGRIARQKGSFDVLQAFAALSDEAGASARLVFAGDGDVDALRERATALGDRVDVHEWIDSARRDALLEASDVFVLPSYAEGVPMAMLEAMAHGLPVVTTAVGGIPDVVSDRHEGLIVEPGNVAELRQAMQTLIEDDSLRLALGRSARTRAERFDVADYGEQLTRIYRRLLAPS
jgi:glycosyltransferase involved in cell wall biosynthesis